MSSLLGLLSEYQPCLHLPGRGRNYCIAEDERSINTLSGWLSVFPLNVSLLISLIKFLIPAPDKKAGKWKKDLLRGIPYELQWSFTIEIQEKRHETPHESHVSFWPPAA
jgi:hypothetical protein